jgi:CheY-like chemotaxis protein
MTITLLIVDDETDIPELFKQYFRGKVQQRGVVLRFATDGAEAMAELAVIPTGETIVILSDINMPGMDGFELLSRIKQRWPQVPVVMISAYGDADKRQRVAALGASGLLSKPLDFGALKTLLRELTPEGGFT